jgi:hypothetical protein
LISRRISLPSLLQISSTRFKIKSRIIYPNVNSSQISSTIISSMKIQSSLSNLIRVTIRYMSLTRNFIKRLRLRKCVQVEILILRHFWKLILTKSIPIKREKSNRLLKSNKATYTNMSQLLILQQSRVLLISSNNSFSISFHKIHWVSINNFLMDFLCKVLLDSQTL